MSDNETQPEWLIGPAVSDLPSVIAAAIMGLPWTHGGTEEEHCYRYGELQEIISAAIAEHSALVGPPDPGSEGRGALAGAIATGCGLTLEGERVLCDDHRVPADVRQVRCDCREIVRAAAPFLAGPA